MQFVKLGEVFTSRVFSPSTLIQTIVTRPDDVQVGVGAINLGNRIYRLNLTGSILGTWNIHWKIGLGTIFHQETIVVINDLSVPTDISFSRIFNKSTVNQDYAGVGGKIHTDGNPEVNVRVRAFDSNGIVKDEVYSNDDGDFNLTLETGTYTLKFFKSNFHRVDSTGVVIS